MNTTSRNDAGPDAENASQINVPVENAKVNKLKIATTLSNNVSRDQSELPWMLVEIWLLGFGIVAGVVLLFCWHLYLMICVLITTMAVASAVRPIRSAIISLRMSMTPNVES